MPIVVLCAACPSPTLTLQIDGARLRGENAADRVQGRGFARAVGTDQGYDFALVHRQGYALQRVDVTIKCVNRIQYKHASLPHRCG